MVYNDNNLVTLKELLPNAYSFSKDVTAPTGTTRTFEESVDYVIEALKKHKFGVVTRLDAHEIFKTKLNVDLARPLVILGVCQPRLALELLQLDPLAACFLPCKVVVTATTESDEVVVSFAKPSSAFAGTGHLELQKQAAEIDTLLEACFNDLE